MIGQESDALVETIRGFVAGAVAKGHAWALLVIRGQRRKRRTCGGRVRIAPGLYGNLVGENERTDGGIDLVVELAIADATAWLERRGITEPAAPPEGPAPTGRPPYGGEMVQDKTWTQLEVMAVRLDLRLVRADDGVSILTTDPTPVFIMSVMPGRLVPFETDKLVRATTFQALNAIASLRP